MCTFKAKWRSRFSGNVCSVINLSPPTEGTKGRVTLINKTNSYPHNFPLLTLDVFSVLSRAKRRSRLSGDVCPWLNSPQKQKTPHQRGFYMHKILRDLY